MQHELIEIGPKDLTFDRHEAGALFDNADIHNSEVQRNQLFERTQGWAAGLQLGSLGLTSRASRASPAYGLPVESLLPGDRYLVEYLKEEVLSELTPEDFTFIEGSSILNRMSGAACDAVLERTDSSTLLEHLAEMKGFFLAPLDQDRHRYQYLPLFAEVLRDELERNDPDRYRRLHDRASRWYETQGDLNDAVLHAIESGDAKRTGRLILSHDSVIAGRGNNETIGGWLARLDPLWSTEVADIAFAGAIYGTRAGNAATVERYLADARRIKDNGPLADGTPSLAVGIAMVSAIAGRFPLQEMDRYTKPVLDAGREGNPWWALASGLQGAASIQMGEIEHGRGLLEAVRDDLRATPPWYALALANLALADLEGGAPIVAMSKTREAVSILERSGIENLPVVVLVWAVAALAEASNGERERASYYSEVALSRLEAFGSHLGFGSRVLVLVPACLAVAFVLIGDAQKARAMCERAEEARGGEPRAELALSYLRHAHSQLSTIAIELPGGVYLTDAERRVLNLLPSHQTLQEMADQLYVSRNTVKTHALTLYRKLGVSTRSDAVQVAREVHLLPDDS
jgi:LuxR family maltose regulon positive regulatory protein